MDDTLQTRVKIALDSFCSWLENFGETSYDHQSYYAGNYGRSAKALYYRKPLLGTLAVAPMVFSEAFLPSARTLFWKPQRFPIADAHYAMGFAFLASLTQEETYYRKAVHFLEELVRSRCPGYQDYAWGYPFDWQTRIGVIAQGTPLITTVPYVYEAFSQVYAIDHDERWREIMRSIARHALTDYKDIQKSEDSASCAYTPSPDDEGGVVNASAYRAFLLTKASIELSEPRYLEVARKNLKFVLNSQNADGSWFYSTDGARDFVDHFHTCFVMKALAKIEQLTGDSGCRTAIEKGIPYYLNHLFDEQRLPKPFSKRPRLTVYRHELYDFAECINLAVLLKGRFPELDNTVNTVISDVLTRWHKRDGSFRARQLLAGWDNVPMHRWAQSQMFRSLSFFLAQNSPKTLDSDANQALASQTTS